MKKLAKMIALLMTLVFVVGALAACGESSNGGDASQGGGNDQPAVKGEVKEHGYYKVFVPEGFTMKTGDSFGDETNPKAFTLNTDDGTYTYYMFNLFSEENAKTSVATTKGMNDGAKDVTVTYNGVAWTGVAYESSGKPCFSLYADFGDDHFVIVSAAGNAYDGDVTDAVLSSLAVNVTE